MRHPPGLASFGRNARDRFCVLFKPTRGTGITVSDRDRADVRADALSDLYVPLVISSCCRRRAVIGDAVL